MKCCRCPLYHYWSNESDRGESCAIFGDGWDSPFQYEDKEGTIVGCYLDRHFIEKADAERDEYYASMAESMARQLKVEADTSQTESHITCYGTCTDKCGAYENGDCTLNAKIADTPQTDDKDTNVLNKRQTDCPWK